MNIRILALAFFMAALAIMFLGSPSSLSGYAVYSGSYHAQSYFYLLSVVFLVISFLLFTYRRTLDVLMIPTEASTTRIRAKSRTAAKWYKEHGAKVIVASGGEMPFLDRAYKNEAEVVRDELRKAGVSDSHIYVEGNSRDTVENVIFTLRKMYARGEHVRDIGIVSYPSHLDRFETIIKDGQDKGDIDPRIRIHRIETDETLTERLWEIPARFVTNYRLRNGVSRGEAQVGLGKRILYFAQKLLQGDYSSSRKR